MKKSTKFEHFYMGLIFFLMYLPIAVVVIFSFNESRLPVKLTGFSLKWYQELIHDSAMLEALVNSLVLGVLSCLVSAVIGTLGSSGTFQDPLEEQRCAGIYFHTSTYDPGDHFRYGPDGVLLYAEPSIRNADPSDRTYSFLCALYSHGGESKTGRNESVPGRSSQGSGSRAFAGILGYHTAADHACCDLRIPSGICHVYG